MAGDFTLIAETLGIPMWFLVIVIVWSLTWKLFALWKSARKSSVVWFIFLAVINTVGILEILYIFLFSKIDLKTSTGKPAAKKKVAKKKFQRRKK